MLILGGQMMQRLILQHGQIHGQIVCGRGIGMIGCTLEVERRHIGIGQGLFMGHISGTHGVTTGIGTTGIGAEMILIVGGIL